MKTKEITIRIPKHKTEALYIFQFDDKELKEFIKTFEFTSHDVVCFSINDFTGSRTDEIKNIMSKAGYIPDKSFINIFISKQKVY